MKKLLIAIAALLIAAQAWGQTCSNTTATRGQHLTHSEWVGNWANVGALCTEADTIEAEYVDVSGDTLTGALNSSVGAAAAAVAYRFGDTATEGLEIRVIDEIVATGAVNNDLTEDIPSGAVILSVQSNVQTALTGGGTTTNVGIGTAGDPDLYSPTVGVLTADGKIDHMPDWAVLSGAEDIQVNAITAAGAAGDTALTVGTVRVRIVFLALNSLDDA